MSKLPACLSGAGMLGHTWVGTLLKNGDERILIHASFGADAIRALDEYKGTETPGDVYEVIGRTRRGLKWARRTRAYALLDQPTDGRKPYEPDMETEATQL